MIKKILFQKTRCGEITVFSDIFNIKIDNKEMKFSGRIEWSNKKESYLANRVTNWIILYPLSYSVILVEYISD